MKRYFNFPSIFSRIFFSLFLFFSLHRPAHGQGSHTPYGGTALSLPGRLEIENYDAGAAGVAYNDLSAGNDGGAYRTDDVDIESADDGPGQYDVGWTQTGEWLVYTVNVATAGSYDFKLRAATPNDGKTIHVEVNNVNVTGSIAMLNTGGFQDYQTFTAPGIPLAAGIQVWKIYMETDDFNLNYFDITPHAVFGSPYGGSPVTFPGRLEFENYNLGGEGLGYHETTAGNAGGSYRTDDVDIEQTEDAAGLYNVGWTEAGEWLAYTVSSSSNGSYDFMVRYATNYDGMTAHIEVDGTNAGGSFALPYSGGAQTWRTLPVRNINLTAGSHLLKFVLETGGLNLNYVDVTASGAHTPYGGTALSLPGRLEIENYDEGAAGVAYNDLSAGNEGGAYRTDDVDIESADEGPGQYDVGWNQTGEWLIYTVNVATAGNYDFKLRAATSGDGKTIHVEVDNVNVTGSIAMLNTGGSQDYQTFTVPNIPLAAGTQVWKIYMETSSFNLNYLDITPYVVPESPYGGSPVALPGRLEFENYDLGGEGLAYHDTTSGNSGHQYRNDDVDIVQTTDVTQAYAIDNTDAGEWLKYTVQVNSAGVYDLKFRYASLSADKTIHVELDGTDVTGSIVFPLTGGAWQTFQKSGVSLAAGSHVLKFVLETGGVDLNYIDISPSGAHTPFGGTPFALPGRLQIENYDLGGEGFAYHDLSTGNSGASYRTDDVDIVDEWDDSYDVGSTEAGEWLVYTVHVDTAGAYDFNINFTTANEDRTLHIEIDNINVSGSVTLPFTGGWQNPDFVNVPGVNLTAGNHVLKLFMETGGVDFDFVDISAVTVPPANTPSTPYNNVRAALPGRVEIENYDAGGEGVAYHDITPGNEGNSYRYENVDIEAADGGDTTYDVGWTEAGEWLKYSVHIASAGMYTAVLRYATPNANKKIRLELDSINKTGSLVLPATGGWQTWQSYTIPAFSLPEGDHVLKIFFETGSMNVNYLEVNAVPLYTSVFTVINTDDSGPGSLRAALDSANANADPTLVNFNIAGNPPHVITSSGDLTLSTRVFVDGSSQPGYNPLTKNPVVQISNLYNGAWTNFYLIGNSKGSQIKGLYLQYGGYYGIWSRVDSVTIRDNVINQIRFEGIYALSCIGFYDAGSYSTIVGNTFDTDSTGADKSLFLSDSIPVGVYVHSTNTAIHDIKIGGFGPGEGNKFAYEIDGVIIDGSGVSNISILANTFTTILDENINFRTSTGTQVNATPAVTGLTGTVLSGTAGVGDIVQIYLSNEGGSDAMTYLGKSTAAAGGTWSFDLLSAQGAVPAGDSKIIATATNTAGSTSMFSAAYRLVSTPLIAQAPANDYNYIVTNTYLKEGKRSQADILLLPVEEVQQSISYLDGLGRPVQSVTTQGAPDKTDVVQPVVYDRLGKASRSYLPYTAGQDGLYKPGQEADQKAFYTAGPAAAGRYEPTDYPFADKVLEQSALNKLLAQGAPGADWQVNTGLKKLVRRVERSNTAEEVRLWFYDTAGTASTGGNYPAGELFVLETRDENGHVSVEYKDKHGSLVLKKFQDTVNVQAADSNANYTSTYYIYDRIGNLRFVVSPEGSRLISGGTFSFAYEDSFTKTWCYAYKYDQRKRMAQKRLPGTAWQYFIYNRKDEYIMGQDGNQRSAKQWHFSKYDVLGRSILTGIYTHADSISQPAMQALADNFSGQYESTGNANAATQLGYTVSNAFPTLNLANDQLYTASYYDDYDFDGDGADDAVFSSSALNVIPYTADNTGQATGGRVRVLGTNTFLASAAFYDDKGRLVQSQEDNAIGGREISTMLYDFSGKVLQTEHRHQVVSGTPALTVNETHSYDHAGRPVSSTHRIDNGPAITLATHAYNKLGQEVEKKLHSSSQSAFLQTVDYRYHVRGWLKSINDAALSDSSDLFGMELRYNENLVTVISPTAQYNGNISEVIWNVRRDTLKQKAYSFTYDPLNRLKGAGYSSKGTGAFDADIALFNEDGITYDKNGNLKTLNRYALLPNASAGQQIDQLTYSNYTGNQLGKVEDGMSASLPYPGFSNGANVAVEYTYDANGNMTADLNKQLTFQYNYLNLPQRIDTTGKYLGYVYDAAGRKLTKNYADGANMLTTDYIGAFEYQSSTADPVKRLQRFSTSEGKVSVAGSLFNYEYFLKDHLGNVRLVFDKDPVSGRARIIQETHYYPFGLSHPGAYASGEQNKYLYNGKELQDELRLGLYDYGARLYDPQLGRWSVPDVLSEVSRRWSPYTYCYNNPLRYTDPDGMFVESDEHMAQLREYGFARVEVGTDPVVKEGVNTPKPNTTNDKNQPSTITASSTTNANDNTDVKSKESSEVENSTASGSPIGWRLPSRSDYPKGWWGDFLFRLDRFSNQTSFMPTVGMVTGSTQVAARTFFQGSRYTIKVMNQMDKVDDIYHAFPKSIDGFAAKFGQYSTKVAGDGKTYQWLEVPGTWMGKKGTFEYIKDANGIINHRMFNVSVP